LPGVDVDLGEINVIAVDDARDDGYLSQSGQADVGEQYPGADAARGADAAVDDSGLVLQVIGLDAQLFLAVEQLVDVFRGVLVDGYHWRSTINDRKSVTKCLSRIHHKGIAACTAEKIYDVRFLTIEELLFGPGEVSWHYSSF